ncbi:hypothetical protein RHGRI_001802 [Rhododendron griersonianum]|uniref:ATP-dependent RNA helicase n=1 Tax=Rhododendron griersonianum TaxID=479676 RepID=A0AAV6LQH7_9ERIC|nr:hypothetical protein RHGRI_001802 [Rhododendron griersonianum]
MPVKLLSEHLFTPSLPQTHLSTVNPNRHIKPSYRAIPIFTRTFPHMLKHQCLSNKLGSPLLLTHQQQRPKTGLVRASKGLIDDEAELSDWVSELASDSVLTRDSGNGSSSSRGRGRDERGGGRGRVSSANRRRESDLGPYEKSNGQMGRDSFGSFSRGKGRGGGDEMKGRNEGFVSPRREESRGRVRGMGRESSNSRGTARNEGFVPPTRENDWRRGSDSGDSGMSNRQMGRDALGSSARNSRGNSRFGSGSEGGWKMPKIAGRGSELGYGRKRGGGSGEFSNGGKISIKGGVLIAKEGRVEEEEDEKRGGNSRKSLADFISEEDSEGEEEKDIDDDGDLFASNKVPSSPETSDSYLSETRFDQCPVSPLSLRGIKDAGYERMTVVQEATLPVILEGKDVLAKAKTGTGKTVAFLLPSIELVVKSPPTGRDQKLPPILVLVMCPTRELASQAATEAKKLLKYHPSLGVQVVIGGTRLALEQKRMQANPCQILVATPGRLKDHIENTAGFATRLMGVKVLVLDEADHLLDMGFRRDIEKIIDAVPKQRQTLLFSATVPEEVKQICHIALKRDHEFINTVEEGSEQTHSQVRQLHLVAPLDQQFSLLYVLLKEHISEDVDYKVLVFCTTAMLTRLVADLLSKFNLNVREIHSRKTQSYRTRVSDEFRKSKGLILVTSDVSARGVDYPDVTLVIQVGLPAGKEQYIHRLGRTGRKGKQGLGILLLSPWEEFFLSTVKDLPITKASEPLVDPVTRKKVEQALSHVEMKNKEAAYQAWLGYYNSNKDVGRDKSRLVELASEFSRSMGLSIPPAIPKNILGKMGLRNVPGLRSK